MAQQIPTNQAPWQAYSLTDNVAFVEAVAGKAYTYGDLVTETRRFAKALRSFGLRKGQVVVVLLPNVAEYGIIALAIMAAGGIYSGANPAAHESEIKKLVQAANAKLIVRGIELPVILRGETPIGSAMNWNELLHAAALASDKYVYEDVTRVAPVEIEAILVAHHSVEDAAKLPDEEAGQIPAACVVINQEAKENEEDTINYVASNVARYKKLRVVHFVESIPK
ncbi:hypothetical protein GH714_017258 [Hevea brasiliensis]|uniref:AMP-dependent synthetase/ligase domain-containing protein n=1 Tax=Hevea brasiliensis TaxID=3981 RepID=A0A6A6KC87_HEVBR|nr:hypothetical protein GH714_017258 [Hevea brasiliensis]